MLKMTCPHCKGELQLDDSRRGRATRCTLCGGAFRAPLEEGQPASGPAPPGEATAEALALGATFVAGAGLLLTGGLWLIRLAGGQLPIPTKLLIPVLTLPFGVILVSWYADRRVRRKVFVWVSRIAAYVWFIALALLIMRLAQQ